MHKQKVSEKAGLPPGSLIYVGKEAPVISSIEIIDYNKDVERTLRVKTIKELGKYKKTKTVSWINITGLGNTDEIKEIGKEYGLHNLLLEDVLNTNQRAKLDEYEDHIFLVFRMFYYRVKEIHSEQISLVIGKNYVLSFQETEGDIFDPIRARIKTGKGKVRKMGSDYLGYCLLDTVVDHYFSIMESIGDELEELEDELIKNPNEDTLQKLYRIKQNMLLLRKSVWPLREAISKFQRLENKNISETTRLYLRDVYDHTIQVIDNIETYRDMTAGMIDIYISSSSQKLNEIMKVLTIIATIFMPLTFIAGVYGMNFDFMPELRWKYGYLIIMSIMGLIGGSMVYYFKKRHWL